MGLRVYTPWEITALPRPSSWIRGKEGDKDGGELGKKGMEGKGSGEGEREGREGGVGERGKGRGGTRPSFERN